MPSDKKRINLTVPDSIYEQLQAYKEEQGLMSDATACLQLIVRQLKVQENEKLLWKFMRDVPAKDYAEASKLGFEVLQAEARKKLPE